MAMLSSLLLAVFAALLTEELYSWSPTLTQVLIKSAVAKLHHSDRARYEAEWTSHLLDYPNSLWRLVEAAHIYWHAKQVAEALAISRVSDAVSKIETIMYERFDAIANINASAFELLGGFREIRRNLGTIRPKLNYRPELLTNTEEVTLEALAREADHFVSEREKFVGRAETALKEWFEDFQTTLEGARNSVNEIKENSQKAIDLTVHRGEVDSDVSAILRKMIDAVKLMPPESINKPWSEKSKAMDEWGNEFKVFINKKSPVDQLLEFLTTHLDRSDH